MASVYIESGLWSILWYRILQVLGVSEIDSRQQRSATKDPDATDCDDTSSHSPDWMLLSFDGLTAALDLGVAVFSRVSL